MGLFTTVAGILIVRSIIDNDVNLGGVLTRTLTRMSHACAVLIVMFAVMVFHGILWSVVAGALTHTTAKTLRDVAQPSKQQN